MDNKRKASGANGPDAGADAADRVAKRRKLIEEFGDLANGESPQSTTAYGLNILESIRATTDKNGRAVSPFFERIPTRSQDPQYYKTIRLPLSLEIIERKLKNHQYANLTALESDFKRLVSNAKEVTDRNSVNFGDAERIRKAVSNLMVKQNPAYKLGNYQATATPLPPSPGPEDLEEEDAEGEEDPEMPDSTTGDEPNTAEAQDENEEDEGDEDNNDDENDEENDEDGEGGDEEDDEEEEEDAGEDDERPEPKRRGGRSQAPPSRQARNSSVTQPQRGAPRGPRPGKAGHHYEGVPFKGLGFQQAQEKVVEEIIRKKDDAEYPYFDAFINLPPRTLKDYYEVIAEPLSLNQLRKQVRGQHGRGEATYISDFKTWAALEDQASLIWKNAYHYNEDGSEISLMAKELEDMFTELVKEAKQHVQEPPQQPKIKLKLPQSSETPGHPKKITIHVGGKASATGSPAPVTGQSADGEATRNGTPIGRNPFGGVGSTGTSISLSQLEKARSMSTSAGPPSPSAIGMAKAEEAARPIRPSPAITPQPAGITFQQFAPPVMHHPQGLGSMPMPNGPNYMAPHPPPQQRQQQQPPPPPRRTAADILEAQKYRTTPLQKETEALMPKFVITSHPALQLENRLSITIPASLTEIQQELILNAPSSHFRLQLRPQVSTFLEAQQREWRLNVFHDGVRLHPSAVSFERRGEPVFDVSLRYGTNRLEASLVAALPKGQIGPHSLNMELEKFVVLFNLLRHQ
ncbi:Uu.00g029460.m01.CDS01 [Anthostomella pinea]|uniref:Uu.00g029460.m01.CDS01 n=1 Tax=Anthostomella pinea TaxID=933095 RepID=A0AAI8V397_9PEZI|nr:Uu.00g029460.m01.CDS01 [Anthostomella pinea]